MWHKENKNGKTYRDGEIFPSNMCPWLSHSVYPYFLGLLHGAKFSYNEEGDCNVCCPGKEGVNVIVRKRKNDGSFGDSVPGEINNIVFAEIVSLGSCPYGHKVGERIPIVMSNHVCPAAVNNILPFMDLKVPECIDKAALRCPDDLDVVYFSVDK